MPIFEYNCRHCEHHFETIVRSRREKVSCPKCASGAVEKQLSVFSSVGSANKIEDSGGGCACTPATCGCH